MKNLKVLLIIVSMFIISAGLYADTDPVQGERPGIDTEIEIENTADSAADIEMHLNDEDEFESDDLVSIGGKINAEAEVSGDVVGIGAQVYINSRVRGDVVMIGSRGKLDSNTIIEGDFVVIGSVFDVHDNVMIEGQKTNISLGPLTGLMKMGEFDFPYERSFTAGKLVGAIAKFILIFIFALLVIVIYKKYHRIEDTVSGTPLKTFLFGLLVEILIVPAIIVLIVSLIGIPFIPLFILAVLFGGFVGASIIMHMFGRYVLKEFLHKENAHYALNLLAGLAVLSILPLIYHIATWTNVGWLTTLSGILKSIQWYTVITFSFGAMFLTRYGTYDYAEREYGNREIPVQED